MNQLEKLRNNASLSQEEISKQLKIPRSTYQGYEQNRNEPSIATLIKLADFFDCSIDYLLGHQSSNLLQLDSLSPVQHDILEEIKSLSDEQAFSVLGYIARVKEIPINEIIEKIKNS